MALLFTIVSLPLICSEDLTLMLVFPKRDVVFLVMIGVGG